MIQIGVGKIVRGLPSPPKVSMLTHQNFMLRTMPQDIFLPNSPLELDVMQEALAA